MDATKLILLGLPLCLFVTDIITLFRPISPQIHQPLYNYYQLNYQSLHHQQHPQHLNFPPQKPSSSIASGIGVGHVISISFCTSYSYRGHAMTTKHMLEEAFPGITVTLVNHPPPLIKRLTGIVIPILQGGVIVIIMGGEQIFQKLGYMKPPPWYYSLRANRHGTIITTWFLGNYIKSCLKNSGAFEVFCDGELVFSKLMEQRFPGEFELRELVSRKLYNLRNSEGFSGGLW